MVRLIEIKRRLLFAVIWFFGGFALIIVTLGLNGDGPLFKRAILIAFGFLVVSYICHTLLNWMLAKREQPLNSFLLFHTKCLKGG